MKRHFLMPAAGAAAFILCAADRPSASNVLVPETPAVGAPAAAPAPAAATPAHSRQSRRVRSAVPPPVRHVAAANLAATLQPEPQGFINAVQVYPFTDGTIYAVYTAPERVTDIALQPGEVLGAVAAGDTVRWVIGDTSSGTGSDKQTHVLVKPFAAGLSPISS